MKKFYTNVLVPLSVFLCLTILWSCSSDKGTEPDPVTVPVVTTATIMNVTETTAECGGNVAADGGAAVTARGICWSTNLTPTIADSKTTDSSGTGSFTSSLTGLTSGTPYYVRAYATNSAGTGYGEERSFTAGKQGGLLVMVHVFSPELDVQIKNPYALLPAVAYQPRVSFPIINGGEQKPVPLLILLPPQGKDHYFYFNHGLQQIADDLIATGEIQPMFIACVSNDLVFGGYLFAGHYPGAGDWDGIIGQSLLAYIETFGITINDPAKRGIGGIGQGAYGAFRAAMLNPGTFTSISAVDGPLDFDGADGSSGLIDLFVPVLSEQGLLGSDTWKEDFDSALVWPYTSLLIGGSLAFSPHDTAITYTKQLSTITITSRQIITDSATLITNVVDADAYNFDFHVPFDNNGDPYAPIWDGLWLPNNLENLPSASLNGVNIWVATSDEASFGYHEQTVSFISTLQGWGYPVTTRTYSGYSDNPATDDQYVYDLLKEMLIFHSQSFGNGD